jgi:hypothetical protein
VVIEKFPYVRSKKLLEACREIQCQVCGVADGTVVAAHSNQLRHGKGRSIKASDVFVAAMCYRHHLEVDQGHGLSKTQKVDMWDAAHRNTVRELVKRGLWPSDCPIPDIRVMN